MGKVNDFLRELTPLSTEDCFLVIQRPKPGFYYPLHTHNEFQLNYLENVSGALRIVGDSVEEMDDFDLALVAGGTKHAYTNHTCKCENIWEVTIQFHQSMFDSLIYKRHFQSIKKMFENASSGMVFSKETILLIQNDLKQLTNDEPNSFKNFIKLLEILKTLSLDENAKRLNVSEAVGNLNKYDTDRLDSIILYMHENHQQQILLSDVAVLVSMSESSLTRFLKKWTGKTFVDNLNDIRIAEAVNRLRETSDSISEICYKCGFNNISNFNRIFKRRKGITPSA
ncbi:AraC family transcriptional regulator, partial [Parabacteroides sp. OttesenSCG-928-G21]|nr:AraC family transcriptional regulator [Parabacteroides sp. OttesenSCG-928-G21]